MNSLQLKAILGYVTFTIEGKQLVQFFHHSSQANIPLWDITILNENKAEVKAYTVNYKEVKALAEQLQFIMTITEKNGLSFYLLSLWHEKQKIVAFICSGLLLFVLSNTVWHVEVSGVPIHLEQKITEQLERMNVYRGAFRTSRLPVETIESNIMETLPQLLYISVKKRGTIYTVEAVEKKTETPEAKLGPRHLIASKSGIIERMLIKDGQAVVFVNEFVKKGDLLVSGEIYTEDNIEETNEKKEDTQPLLVVSKGEVFANTWYEVNVSSHLHTILEQLQGEKTNHYYINVGKLKLPIKFWPKINYSEIKLTETSEQLRLFKRKLPLTLVKKTSYEKKTLKVNRTEKEAKQDGINHALEDLRTKLGKDAEIIKYYILHEKVESGKVKLRLYVSVLENIAEPMPISNPQE